MGKSIFVTGTGTDVGKTYVSALLVKKLKADYYKPVLSGAKWINHELVAMDAKYVLDESGIKVHPNKKVSYLFEEALSPHLSSRRIGLPIEMEKIMTDFKKAKEVSDYLVVEGAGGIICPLREGQMMLIDVIKEMNLPIIIVCHSHLGAINNVMLTVEYARMNCIKIAGIVMNFFESGDLICEDNLKMIEKLSGLSVIDTVAKGQKELNISNEELWKS
jgi:dethiobiotin synthetase